MKAKVLMVIVFVIFMLSPMCYAGEYKLEQGGMTSGEVKATASGASVSTAIASYGVYAWLNPMNGSGIMAALAKVGGIVSGGAAGGVAIVATGVVVVTVVGGYGGYKLYQWYQSD